MLQAEMGNSRPASAETTDIFAKLFAAFPRPVIEDGIESLIALLDRDDGDPEREEDNDDRCASGDDCGGGPTFMTVPFHLTGPGDPEDAEDDDPAGPITEAEALRAWYQARRGIAA